MSEKYVSAVTGQEITDEMIDRWCEAYDKGEFPEGEYTEGGVRYGRPPLSNDPVAVLSVKMPSGMKKAIEQKAKAQGVTVSAYARNALADTLLTA